MDCALCAATIDNDSFYCDMCGKEIMLCPTCHVPRKGKVCTACGSNLMLAKKQGNLEASNESPSQQAETNHGYTEEHPPTKYPLRTVRMADKKSGKPMLRLINFNLPADIRITEKTLLGRTSGPLVHVFSVHDHVSGEHCCFEYVNSKGWTVIDLHSENGTLHNGNGIVCGEESILSHGDMLKIANVEFHVKIEAP